MAQAGQEPNQQSQDPAGQANQEPQQQDPGWLSAIADEAMRNEARQGHLFHKDYTQKTQELAKERDAYKVEREAWDKEGKATTEAELKKYTDWYSAQYTPFKQKIESRWDDINAVLEGNAQIVKNGATPTAQQTLDGEGQYGVPNGYWENYDVLTPQEQAQKQYSAVMQHGITPAVKQGIEQLQQNFNQQIQQREQVYGNYLKLLTDGFTKKLENPNFDINSYMSNALKIQTGQVDPMKMAYSMTMADEDRKSIEETAYKRGKADQVQEHTNQQQSDGAQGNGLMSLPFQKPQPRTRAEIENEVRGKAAKDGIPWFSTR